MRIGTRGSALALAQADLVSRLLGGCEIVTIATAGDRGADGADKSRWTKEIEDASRPARSTSPCTPPRTSPPSWRMVYR